jgi:transposase-like protein
VTEAVVEPVETHQDIGRLLNVSHVTVMNRVKKYGSEKFAIQSRFR